LRKLSAKVFLPASLLFTFSFNSIASNGFGDSLGVKTVTPTSNKQLQLMKSIGGLTKPSKMVQVQADADDLDEVKPAIAAPSVPVRFSGYVRSFNQYRTMDKYYNDMYGGKNNLTINGVDPVNNLQSGYAEPLMMLQADASPSARTAIQVQYYLDNQMTGQRLDSGRQRLLYRSFNFKGNIYSKVGTFTLTAGGGQNWARLSPLTLGNPLQYNRLEMFERLPWQYHGSSGARYNELYETQVPVADVRWARAATQGVILEGSGLPAGFGFTTIYGKTDNSGGVAGFVRASNSPFKNFFGSRIYNNYYGHEIGINFFNQFGYTNAIQLKPENQKIISFDLKLKPKNFNIYLEMGAGSYASPDYKENWTAATILSVQGAKEVIGFPFNIQTFSIGQSVVNVSSDVLNTSIPYVQGTYPGQAGIFSRYDGSTFPGFMSEVGQLTNNRQGVNLQMNPSIGKLKIAFGYSVNQEIENKFNSDPRYNQISFQHKLNAFTRSRFSYFQTGGPYSNILGSYRRVFEKIQITDATVDYLKSFNIVDLNLKYKISLFHKDLILVNYSSFSSAQDKLSASPILDNSAFVRYFFDEFTTFYSIHKKVALIGFAGVESMKANDRTELVDNDGHITNDKTNGKARDQFGTGYGLGIDYDFAPKAGLFFRHRWFDHKDKNFILDEFKGQESSVELKIFF